MSEREIIIGPPGTGKTTTLLGIIDDALQRGMPASKIGFLTFTRKAAKEAINRAMKKFNLKEKDLPFFRTIHSLTNHQLGLTREQVFASNSPHYKRFADLMNLELTCGKKVKLDEDSWIGATEADRLMMCQELARVKMISLREQWMQFPSRIDWFALERCSDGLQAFKKANGVVDFTDMLMQCLDEKIPMPKFDLLIIDEAQDLSKAQWMFVERLIKTSEKTYIAGDDDQAIFNWSGADVNYFINMKGKITVLDQSYRIPKKIKAYADKIITGVSNRREKIWKSTDNEGDIKHYVSYEDLDMSKGEWYVLARNAYLLYKVAKHCEREGLFYHFRGENSLDVNIYSAAKAWGLLQQGKDISIKDAKKIVALVKNGEKIAFDKQLENINAYGFKASFQLHKLFQLPWYEAFTKVQETDIEYIRAMLRRDEKLTKTPRITLSTIHGVKGGEAENVALITDVSLAVFENLMLQPDDEKRTYYTGVMRTKDTLHLILPETDMYYEVY